MTASPHLQRKRSLLAIWIRILGLCYAWAAVMAILIFPMDKTSFFGPPMGMGSPPRVRWFETLFVVLGFVLAAAMLVFARWVAGLFLPAYRPPFALPETKEAPAHAPDQALWLRMMGDARRPHRLLLLGVVLLMFAVDSLLLIGLRLVDPYIIGFRVIVYPMTVVSAMYLAMPGVLALVWAVLLWWQAFSERREVRKLVRVRY